MNVLLKDEKMEYVGSEWSFHVTLKYFRTMPKAKIKTFKALVLFLCFFNFICKTTFKNNTDTFRAFFFKFQLGFFLFFSPHFLEIIS